MVSKFISVNEKFSRLSSLLIVAMPRMVDEVFLGKI